MSFYPVFASQINRACFEFCLHYPETFLDLPTFLVYTDYLIDSHVINVCANGVETVILAFFFYESSIKIGHFNGAYLAVFGNGIFCYEAMRVILILRTLFILTTVDQFFCTIYLPLAYLTLIVSVLDRIRYDKVLFEGLCPFSF